MPSVSSVLSTILFFMSSISHLAGLLVKEESRISGRWMVDMACLEMPLSIPYSCILCMCVWENFSTQSYLGFFILFRVLPSPREPDTL